LDLRQLRYFKAVALSGSFVAASRVLHISQPAIGYQIKQLEDALGTELLLRGARGVTMTESGKALLGHAEDVLKAVERAQTAMDGFRNQLVGDITIGVTPTSGRALAPELLKLVAEETRLHVTLRQGMSNELLSEVMSGHLDLAFCYDPPSTERIRLVPLYREPLMGIGVEELIGASSDPIDFDELVKLPLLLDNRFQTIRQVFDQIILAKKLPQPDIIDLEPINLKREMIVHHRRCTVAPYGLFLDEIQLNRVRARLICNPVIVRNMKLAIRAGLPDSFSSYLLRSIKTTVAQRIKCGDLGWEPAEQEAEL
jgi:LysR family nitrogen assimilation transcriptional regulator